jgi:class 3 adenylate cyclase
VSACANCTAEMADGVKFCRVCGMSMAVRSCPSCGAPGESGSFCGECGAALAPGASPTLGAGSSSPAYGASVGPVAQRRVTSVLFGDLVGFTPLSESRDAEEVRELLSQYFTQCRVVIGRYGGVVEKFIGDAVMAVWGVPVAHEDDAERAVRAGLDLVATVAAMGHDVGAPGLAMRVGIVTGEVAVTVGATAEGMVAGDAVNTASRVQSVAEPGRVWVDETTRSLSSAAISFEDAGEHPLKGKAEPLRLWRAGVVVAEVGGGQRVDGLEAPLAGRDSDLRLVKDLFHATQESGRPRLVVLDGEAGVGKSRLAWEFEKYVDGLAATVRWHRGRCLSYGDGVAFWALAEAIRARLGLVEADTGEVVTEHLDAGLDEFVADPSERDWLRPRLAVLLGAGSGAGFAREDLFAAWTAFLEQLSRGDSAVVLVVDDAQHADDGLLDFLDHLLANARAPIFVMALARPELLARRPNLGGRRVTIVRLEPLDEAAMAKLIDGLVVGLPARTRAALVARAEGVPLFAVETVRALIDRDLVIPREGRYVPADGADLDLDAIGAPASLQALVAARLDALTAEERQVVTDASVLGATFTRDGLVALGCDPQSLDEVLGSLVRREIVAVQTDRFSAERGQYRFVQSVVRQVAYGTQSRRDRKTRHLAAADHLTTQPDLGDDLAVVIAQHLLDSVDAAATGDPDIAPLTARAARYLERAATRARGVGAPAEAKRLLESTLARTDEPADRARLHLAAARAAVDAAHYTEGRDHAVAATALFDDLADPVQAGFAAAAHAMALFGLRDNAAAIEVAEPRWRALEGARGSERAQLDLCRRLSGAHAGIGEWDAQREYTERFLLLAEALDDPEALATAHSMISVRYSTIGAPATAVASYQTAAAIAREHELLDPLSMALGNLTGILNSRDLEVAPVLALEAIDVSRRAGLQVRVDLSVLNYLIGLWTAGRLAEADTVLADAVDTVTDPGLHQCLRTIQGWLADVHGEPIPARQGDEGESIDDESTLAWRDSDDITRALAAGDAASAASIAARSIDHLLTAGGIEDDFMVLWPPLVQAALAAGDTDLAERLLQPVATAQPGRVAPGVAAQWHRLRGLVAAARGDDPEFVEAELRTGIAALDTFGAVGHCARAREELARWLVDQHRPGEAEPLIEAARITYTAIGATGWLAEIDSWHAARTASRG